MYTVQKVLEVVPATMEGMVFETRNEIHGRRVFFVARGRRVD